MYGMFLKCPCLHKINVPLLLLKKTNNKGTFIKKVIIYNLLNLSAAACSVSSFLEKQNRNTWLFTSCW